MRDGGTKRGWPRLVPVFRVKVDGWSMAPGLLPGDRLLVARTRRLRPGDIAVGEDPREPGRPLIKRVAAREPDGRLVLLGDNPPASTDSRTFGPVAPDTLKGRAVYRYAPSERTGRLR